MLQVKKLTESAKLVKKAHETDLGYDVFADENVYIKSGESKLIDTGIAVQFPDGWGCFVKDRSSYAAKRDLETAAGVIDPDYTGEVKILMRNHSNQVDVQIEGGDKIAQLVPVPLTNFEIEEINNFEETKRGDKGFGSSGNK